jgi:putative NIF3 family GTP cyclohydrolase 1 type 2
VSLFLKRTQERYEKLPPYLKDVFDQEELTNPFADTRIYHGDPEQDVSAILAGIDMNVGEVLLADRLRQRGVALDALFTHHPEGWGLSKLDLVMSVQADIWASVGVPIQAAEKLINERRKDVRHRVMPVNHTQAIDAARLLNLPFFGAHTPTDNLVFDYLTRYFTENEPQLLEDVLKLLFELPEYRIAARQGAGPSLVDGAAENRAGRILVDMTGGTEGPVKAIAELADKGVGTIVCMHMGEELRKAADEHNVHVLIAGHMASDSLGVNLLMDEFERRGVTVVPTSGLIRVRRNERREVIEEVTAALPR